MNSAQSRASLRHQFKNRLEESRHAAEERRSKSPVISVPSQRSLDDQLIEDDDFPIPDEIKGSDSLYYFSIKTLKGLIKLMITCCLIFILFILISMIHINYIIFFGHICLT